ncbi:MAG: thiamine diphosphokinase [Clostridia bacterium]|nr:thiamine diphosphokinase [Clostridia bacterium]
MVLGIFLCYNKQNGGDLFMETKNQNCGIFLGGSLFNKPKLTERIKKLSYLIAADSGCDMLLELGLMPNLLLGDMDSISPRALSECRAKQVEIITCPVAKDFTDGEMALSEAAKRGYDKLEIYAAYGSRLDHTLANIFTTVPYAEKGMAITFVNKDFMAYLTTGDLTLEGKKGDTVSLLSLSQSVLGVTLQGFQYPLQKEELHFTSARGVSNVMSVSVGHIYHTKGLLLVIHYPQKKDNI